MAPYEKYKAIKILEGVEKIGCDVMNVSAYDLAAGLTFIKSLEDSSSIPFISANIVDNATGELCFEPYVLLENGPFTVGVTGVTKLLSTKEKEVRLTNYLSAGKSYIDALKKKADIVVVLVAANRRDRNEFMEVFSEADYIFQSRDLSKIVKKDLKETQPFIYTSNKQGKYLSVVELTITDIDSPFVDVTKYNDKLETLSRRLGNYQRKDISKTLEEIYADQPSVLKQIQDILREQLSTEETLASIPNKNHYKNVAMNRQIGEDKSMLQFVKKSLEQYEKLGGTIKKSKPKKNKPTLKRPTVKQTK